MHYVYSTGTTNVEYDAYSKPVQGNLPQRIRKVVIRGGANRANKHLETPKGIRTEVSDDDAEFLQNHPTFKRHMAAGFVTISKYKVDADGVAVDDLTPKDRSAPKTPADFAAKAPKVGKELPTGA